MKRAVGAGFLIAVLSSVGCGPQPEATTPAAQPATPQCSSVWKDGFWPERSDLSAGIGRGFRVLINLTADYELRDPNLAHDVFPGALVNALNANAVVGMPSYQQFAYQLADGEDAALRFNVTFTRAETGDQYGQKVVVVGPQVPIAQWGTATPMGPLFTLTFENKYVTAQKLIDDTASRVNEFIFKGWTCAGDVAQVNRPGEAIWPGPEKWPPPAPAAAP